DDDDALETTASTSVALWYLEDRVSTGALFSKRELGNFDANRLETFDVAASAVGASGGYHGGAFDGHYVYFAPRGDSMAPHGEILRFDTQAALTDEAAWQKFVPAPAFPSLLDIGAVFDGRYVYFIPLLDDMGQPATRILRYDTQAEFSLPTSWSSFALNSTFPNIGGFAGGSFDGRFVYFVP